MAKKGILLKEDLWGACRSCVLCLRCIMSSRSGLDFVKSLHVDNEGVSSRADETMFT